MIPFDFMPITIEVPDMSIQRGGIRFPKFTLEANALPVAIKGGHGLMVRLVSNFGYQGAFTGEHLDVHDQDNLLTVRVVGVLRGNADAWRAELLHVESRHDATGLLAEIMRLTTADRYTAKAKHRAGLATFKLQLFRPVTA